MTTPQSLSGRAEADLAFVRDVLDRSHHFSAVPGVGGVLMGASALLAVPLARAQPSRDKWITVWVAEAAVAIVIGALMLVRKARQRRVPLSGSPARRFALGLAPPVLVGALLTAAALRAQAWDMVVPIWLCCYGIGVLAAGAVSAVSIVPVMGAIFVVLGAAAVATPIEWHDVWLALGFGGAHIIVGAIIARRHGG